jgi:hypothetical protein
MLDHRIFFISLLVAVLAVGSRLVPIEVEPDVVSPPAAVEHPE